MVGKMKISKIQLIGLLAVWFVIGGVTSSWLTRVLKPELLVIDQVMTNIEKKSFTNKQTRQQLASAAVQAILSSIDDDYATFFDPQVTNQVLREFSTGERGLIGIQGEMQAGQFVITVVTPGMPAAEKGLLVGDVIVSIDGWQVSPTTNSMDVIRMVSSSQSPEAVIEIIRSAEKMTFAIPRQPVEAIQTKMLTDIAYIRFDIISEETPNTLLQELEKINKMKPMGIILDLRYNGGGLMESTRGVLDLFEKQGVAFYAKNSSDQLIPFLTRDGEIAEDIPLVVLTSGQTYSASETIAASLRENERAVLIGEKTHGKGSIVETIRLSDGSSIQISVARWLSPLNQTDYEGQGVAPDVEFLNKFENGQDLMLAYAEKYLRDHALDN